MDKQLLLQLLADNQMDDLFSKLKSRQGYYSDLVLLEGQWNELRSKQRHGTISNEQANLDLARIRKSLLELIEITFGERPPAPAPSFGAATARGYPKWAVPAGLVLLAVVATLVFLKISAPAADVSKLPPVSTAPAGSTTPAVAVQESSPQSKMLVVSPNPIALNKGRIGDITYKLLSAELSEQNPDNWLLRIKAKIIKPAYGASVVGACLHIGYGDEEKWPVHIDFPYVGPNTTADGVVEFEVPKTVTEVNLLIYPTPGDPPGATIPIKL